MEKGFHGYRLLSANHATKGRDPIIPMKPALAASYIKDLMNTVPGALIPQHVATEFIALYECRFNSAL